MNIYLTTSSCPGINTICLWSPSLALRFDVEHHSPLIVNNYDSVSVLNRGPHLSMSRSFHMDFECQANDRTCMYGSFTYNITVYVVALLL